MSENKGILIITTAADGKTAASAAELFGAASSAAPAGAVNAAVIGTGTAAAALETGTFGVSRAFAIETAERLPGTVINAVISAVSALKPYLIIMAEDDLGRDLAPMLASALQTAAVTDVVSLKNENGQTVITRPVYGGNALADYVIETEPQIITIRPKAFEPAAAGNGQTPEITELSLPADECSVCLVERFEVKQEGLRIEDAKIVIGGGRGLGGPEGFAQLKELADLVGGSVGASRPPCDQDWWPESAQIGITGKVIAPDLYIAIGISGSSQHLSGVAGAKTTVAINKDPEANIFNSATYGIVADWKKVLPALTVKVRELTGN
ncbi:MAG: electron transfer flavoprotein subunit alpha/FixB family protein [Dehalogenimonas sp.]|uniref:Electron transfer flavoprotein subunit alpha/FixB family protein n=1 Tax=Candidatus Dehalogenimonas loeffleri TaxID=3127115 RepID=A0ABZ2J3W1_9CHLR|nr:electron transfer flavoprotein subunit alpha/FixB family protein [Dehalogenimonas sp.]